MEKTNGIERSETWNKIYNIVKTLPREKVLGDAPDAPSVTTSIEQLFLKLLPIHDVTHSVLPLINQISLVRLKIDHLKRQMIDKDKFKDDAINTLKDIEEHYKNLLIDTLVKHCG